MQNKSEKNTDPRVKFIILLCVSTISVFIQNIFILFVIFISEFLYFVFLKSKKFSSLMYMRKLLSMIFPILLFQTILYYNPLFPIYIIPNNIPIFGGWILLSWDGIFYGLMISLRFMILIFAGSIFAMTTNRKDFLLALTKMKIPYIISFMVSLALYFLPLILLESDEIQMAMEAKGISITHGGIRARLANLKTLLTTILFNFILNTNNMAMALQARGFRIKGKRTYFHEISISILDVIVLFSTILLTISAFFIMCCPYIRDYNFWGYGISIFDYWLFKLNGSCQLEIFFIKII
ncbi:MAG: energy-coupling factor transporter transmembrane component T family protein [Promethearchaeota archaeon]